MLLLGKKLLEKQCVAFENVRAFFCALITNCLLVNTLAYCWLLEFEKKYILISNTILIMLCFFRKMEERKEEIRKEILRQILPPGVDESQLQSAEDQFGPPIDNLNLPQVCSTIYDKNFRDRIYVEQSSGVIDWKNESLQEANQALAVCL